MPLLDRFGRALPESPKHVRAIGFHGGTRLLKEDEDVVEFSIRKPEGEFPPNRDAPEAT